MASETLKVLLMIAPFGVLGSALYWLSTRTPGYALVPTRIRHRPDRR
jgi:hypothetical protein